MVEKKRKQKAYQDEPSYIENVAWNRTPPHLTGMEAMRIQAWKSEPSLGYLTLNTEEEFRTITQEAMAAVAPFRTLGVSPSVFTKVQWDLWETAAASAIGQQAVQRMRNPVVATGLYQLSGIRYPRASAFLAIIDPSMWPVIDRHAVRAVFGPLSSTSRDRRNDRRNSVSTSQS